MIAGTGAGLTAAGAVLCLVSAGAALGEGRGGKPVDSGTLPQTRALPSVSTPPFRARMNDLWRGIATDSVGAAMPAFFPRAAYLQVKQIPDPSADYQRRLVVAYRLDIHAAHELLGGAAPRAKLLRIEIPRQWAWIEPGYCYNRIGYWHAPGARLVYETNGQVRSFGVFSFISWRGEWYVVHLAVYNEPGTVDDPSSGPGTYGPAGGC